MAAAQPPASALAPGLLVAAPALSDPNFAGSLVLMAEHHGEGALGFVLNRTAPIDVKELLAGVDAELRAAAEVAGRAGGPVLVGGPVQPERLWILFRPEADRALPGGEVVQVGGDLALGDGLGFGLKQGCSPCGSVPFWSGHGTGCSSIGGAASRW